MAQGVASLPQPGALLNSSPAFEPVMMKGLKVHADNPLLFDFIMDSGHEEFDPASPAFKAESDKLIKYFLASLTIREKDLWVNLSPYEKDRLINEELGKTTLGRDMLSQDYILKQLTSSLIYPEKDLGKKFWDAVYAGAREKFGPSAADIPVDTFNKVWITADKARVLEHNGAAYVVGAHLKVMIESDYIATSHVGADLVSARISERADIKSAPTSELAKQFLKDIIIPAIEKEVNEGANFAPLRQIFYSMILATWYKRALKDALLNQVYSDKAKTSGFRLEDLKEGEKIYSRYLEAYKKGVFNQIREVNDPLTGEAVPRKYFSGGLNFGVDAAMAVTKDLMSGDSAEAQGRTLVVRADMAMSTGPSAMTFRNEPRIRLRDWQGELYTDGSHNYSVTDMRTAIAGVLAVLKQGGLEIQSLDATTNDLMAMVARMPGNWAAQDHARSNATEGEVWNVAPAHVQAFIRWLSAFDDHVASGAGRAQDFNAERGHERMVELPGGNVLRVERLLAFIEGLLEVLESAKDRRESRVTLLVTAVEDVLLQAAPEIPGLQRSVPESAANRFTWTFPRSAIAGLRSYVVQQRALIWADLAAQDNRWWQGAGMLLRPGQGRVAEVRLGDLVLLEAEQQWPGFVLDYLRADRNTAVLLVEDRYFVAGQKALPGLFPYRIWMFFPDGRGYHAIPGLDGKISHILEGTFVRSGEADLLRDPGAREERALVSSWVAAQSLPLVMTVSETQRVIFPNGKEASVPEVIDGIDTLLGELMRAPQEDPVDYLTAVGSSQDNMLSAAPASFLIRRTGPVGLNQEPQGGTRYQFPGSALPELLVWLSRQRALLSAEAVRMHSGKADAAMFASLPVFKDGDQSVQTGKRVEIEGRTVFFWQGTVSDLSLSRRPVQVFVFDYRGIPADTVGSQSKTVSLQVESTGAISHEDALRAAGTDDAVLKHPDLELLRQLVRDPEQPLLIAFAGHTYYAITQGGEILTLNPAFASQPNVAVGLGIKEDRSIYEILLGTEQVRSFGGEKASEPKDPAMQDTVGGIDLDAGNMSLDVARQGRGIEMKLDPALLAKFRRGDFSGIVPHIVSVTQVASPGLILGIK
jgi:hypothetical protein